MVKVLVCDWIKKGGLFLHSHWFPPKKKRREKSEYIKAPTNSSTCTLFGEFHRSVYVVIILL